MASFTASPSNWTNSSDANFRAWGSYIAARFLAVGLVQTADTGQINWATVTAPAGASTNQGYEIWRFADALQSTAPVYFKVFYGSEASSANNPRMQFIFGTGSDGAGNLSGTLSTTMSVGASASAGAGSIFGSGSTNRFVLSTLYVTASAFWFMFERTRDANGDVTSEGVWFAGKPNINSGSCGVGFWNRSTGMVGPAWAVNNTVCAMFPDTTGITGTQTIVSPIFPEKGIFGNPILSAVGYLTSDIAAASTPTIYMYGQPHTYYCVTGTAGIVIANWRGPSPGSTGEAMAILYE
jgi:hypothetical protein